MDNEPVQLARRGFLRLLSALPAALAVFRSTPVQAAPVSEAPRWQHMEAIDNRYRPAIEARCYAAGMKRGELLTAKQLERIWPKAQWLRERDL